MKALVTGGAGFLGRYLVRELVKNGIETVVFDRDLSSTIRLEGHGGDITFVEGDVLDHEPLAEAMKGCDVVFHTAAIADIDEARTKPFETMNVNVMGTVNCLESAFRESVRRFLYASSVYTSGNRGSFYRVSKKTGEDLCKTYSEEYGLEYTIVKYGSLYGRDSNHWNFIYTVCKTLLTHGEFTYSSSPDALREYIHISDAARETVRIARDPEFACRSVLITGHQRMKVSEIFDTINEILGNSVTISYLPGDRQIHYVRTPYSFEKDVPVRINPEVYVDIAEGILDCLEEVHNELEEKNQRSQ